MESKSQYICQSTIIESVLLLAGAGVVAYARINPAAYCIKLRARRRACQIIKHRAAQAPARRAAACAPQNAAARRTIRSAEKEALSDNVLPAPHARAGAGISIMSRGRALASGRGNETCVPSSCVKAA